MATWRLPAIRRLYGVDSLRSVLLPQQQASAVALAVGVTMSIWHDVVITPLAKGTAIRSGISSNDGVSSPTTR